jgi:hypothetical protein
MLLRVKVAVIPSARSRRASDLAHAQSLGAIPRSRPGCVSSLCKGSIHNVRNGQLT